MISVLERLIESWLDNQTERRYQPAFIQLLISEGWNVLHNTRHSPIEFGKDVIARDPDGVLHCFQLKGNPNGRVTKTEAQSQLPQVIELIEASLSDAYLSYSRERYVAVWVTNGEIDEEARLLLESAGKRSRIATCPAKKLELWSRGTLTNRFLKSAGTVWPTTLEGTRNILDFLAKDGSEIPNHQDISSILVSCAPPPTSKTNTATKSSRLSALLLLAEILKAPLYSSENHYGLYVVTVLASVQGLRFADSAKRKSLVEQYARLALEHCADLVSEAKRRKYDPDLSWAQRDMLAESEIMLERRRLVGDCAATLLLSGTNTYQWDWDYARKLTEATFFRPHLWGFGAFPSLIVRYWATCLARIDLRPDFQFANHLHVILQGTMGRVPNTTPLASPYYSFTDCWAFRHKLRTFADDDIFSDSFINIAWFARAVLFMLAKRNYKVTCKNLWPTFSQVLHEEPSLPSQVFFDSRLSREGRTKTYTFLRKEWKELVREAVDDSDGAFLEQFSDLSWLVAAYISIVPYRAWTGVLMWLDAKFNSTWYSRDHLPR